MSGDNNKDKAAEKDKAAAKADEKDNCFIIMPISDPESHEPGHFKKVYDDILRPACDQAGLNAIRADDVTETNLIHLDILKKLIDSPMAICDLSTRNPNVLFELGLRQAFDKPTLLVQEIGTPKIFDISLLRITNYRPQLKYREVLEDQKIIAVALESTKQAGRKKDGVNSIVKLLGLAGPARIEASEEHDPTTMMKMVMAEVGQLRSELRRTDQLRDNPLENELNNMYGLWGPKESPSSIQRLAHIAAEVIAIENLAKSGTPNLSIKIDALLDLIRELAKSDIDLRSRKMVLRLMERLKILRNPS